jgi:hypothetical protein
MAAWARSKSNSRRQTGAPPGRGARLPQRDTIVPFLLQTRLEKLGARYTSTGFMVPHVVTDVRFVTGQTRSARRAWPKRVWWT